MKPLTIAPLLFLLALGGSLLVLGWMTAPAQPGGAPTPPAPSTTSSPRTTVANEAARVSALAAHSDEATTARPIRLRIVDRTGVPVADADVVFGDEARRNQESAPASAITRRSDREGFVDLQALPCEPLLAQARKGTLHGTLEFDPTDWAVPDNVLVVDTDKDLHLLVADAQGRPQPEIRILVEALTGPPDEADCWQRIAALESDDRGLAVAPHVHDAAYWPVDGHRQLRVSIVMLGVPRTPLVLRLDDIGTNPIPLRCPDHGRLHVRTWQRPGVRSTLATKILVRESNRDEHVGHWRIERRLPEDVIVAPVGRDWRVRTMLHDEVFVRGPRSAGDVVVVDLYERPATWFVLHVQGTDGAPLAHHQLVDPSELHVYASAWTTDAKGRLRLPHHVRSAAALLGDASGHSVGVVAWQLPKCDEGPAHDIDLGTVRIQPLSRRVTGVVRDAATQRPIARANCSARTAGADLPLHRTDADGRFELHVVAGAPLQLWANAPGHAAAHLEFAGGTSDLELTVDLTAAGGRSEVRPTNATPAIVLGAARIIVLHDPQLPSGSWELVCGRNAHAATADASTAVRPTTRVPGALTFLGRGLEPGSYHASVVDRCSEQRLGHLASIAVPGGRLSDGDGLTIDLRGKVQQARCQLRARTTGEATEALFFLDAPQEGARFVEASGSGAFRATLPVGIELPLIVVPENGLPERSVLRGGLTTIAWSEPPTCTVVVHGLPEGVPNERLRVQPFLIARNEPLLDELALAGAGGSQFAAQPNGPSSLRSRADEAQAASCPPEDLTDGVGTVPLRWRGRYAFLLQVQNADGEWNTLYERTPELVEITAGGAQTVELVVDPERVRALL
jgi:hypothetical protein